MRRKYRNRLLMAVAAVVAAVLPMSAATAAAAPHDGPQGPESQGWYEVFSPDGTITLQQGGPDTFAMKPRAGGNSSVEEFANNGPSSQRLDLVFVGDGYTAGEMGKYHDAVASAWNALMNTEPLRTYQKYFNGWRVDVPSGVSGISNDPTNGDVKPTALGMRFWCHDIERLLCVDTDQAKLQAAKAPTQKFSSIVAIANTDTYGGSGGNVTTLSGGNQFSNQVLVHEMGHTIAHLGDEYDTPYGASGGAAEPDQPNISAKSDGSKWARWLGAPTPDGGTIGAFDGANYYSSGFYRPSADSVMRSLGKEFNAVSIEAWLKGIYDQVNIIDGATYEPRGYLLPTQKVSLITQEKVGADQPLVWWGLDGKILDSKNGQREIDLSTVPMEKGKYHSLTVTARDTTPWMRDEAYRDQRMTQTISWWVWGG